MSQQICQYFKQCQDGKHEAVRSQINMLPKAALQQCMSHSCTDDDDDDDDDDVCFKLMLFIYMVFTVLIDYLIVMLYKGCIKKL